MYRVVLFIVGLLILAGNGQSKLMTGGLILLMTGAYSTFFLGRTLKWRLSHSAPYLFAVVGAVLLVLAPDFRHAVQATVLFVAVTALMHGSVVHEIRKAFQQEELLGASA